MRPASASVVLAPGRGGHKRPLRSQNLTGIALALAGRAGERLAALLDLTAGRSSLLRRVRFRIRADQRPSRGHFR